MAYQVLARKWRPQTFAEVVGQEHISRTLRNAIVQNRIGHAYLFVGSRGIGKTTSARIFAKALNCEHNIDGEPCCKCQSCLEIAAGNSLDVVEIDGASHNKVEDIRDIRDSVQYAPTHGRFKIYIIDEVHMLTTQAWNALLKTLEEPPEHVKFLFATTEPHKVLPTIVSRCQRFDLKRISVPLISQRLRQIADGEGIHVEDAALAAIARAADGGMRDAQSIFDQMIAFCGGLQEGELIREQDVIDVFGLASGSELREISAGVFMNDINRAMMILQKLADSGRDLERLFSDLIYYVRNIMIAGMSKDPQKLLEVSDSELADLIQIGKSLDGKTVQRVLQGLVAQEWNFRAAVNKRVYFETVLAKVILDAHSVQLDDIIRQLNILNGTMPALQTQVEKPSPFVFSAQNNASATTAEVVPQPAPDTMPAPKVVPAAVTETPAGNVAPSPMSLAPTADVASVPAGNVVECAPAVSLVAPVPNVPDMPEPPAAVSQKSPMACTQELHTAENPLGQFAVAVAPVSNFENASNTGVYDVPTDAVPAIAREVNRANPPRNYSSDMRRQPPMGGQTPMGAQPSMAVASPAPKQVEASHTGMRRPNAEDMNKLNAHPFAQKINRAFSAVVIDARVPENHQTGGNA